VFAYEVYVNFSDTDEKHQEPDRKLAVFASREDATKFMLIKNREVQNC